VERLVSWLGLGWAANFLAALFPLRSRAPCSRLCSVVGVGDTRADKESVLPDRPRGPLLPRAKKDPEGDGGDPIIDVSF
jgi:hypothetical protein